MCATNNNRYTSKLSSSQTVAVIIPFYNGSKWLERAVISVINQTYKAKEIIIVNDGSTTQETSFLENLNKKYKFKIINKENGGQGSARNFGVTASDSKYICFLDQDDYYIPTHIELLLEKIPERDYKFGYVYGDCIEADGEGNIVRTSMIKEHSVHPKTNIFDLIRNDMFILPSAALISKLAFIDIGGFDEQFTGYEDDDLFLRFFRAGYNGYFIDSPVYVWCINSESTSYSLKMCLSRYKYFLKLANTFTDNPVANRFFFKDLIIPRFEKHFINDILKSSDKNKEYKDTVINIFNQYKKVVYGNKNVSHIHKFYLSVIYYILKYSPLSILRVIYKFSKLKYIRKIIKKIL